MKRTITQYVKKIFIIEMLIYIFFLTSIYATETEVLDSQKESLHISDFIKQAQSYTKDTFQDMDFDEVLESAMTGKVDHQGLYKNLFPLLGKELTDTLKTFGAILVVIVIHSILKSISDGLENKTISQVTYYAQYVLIVTLIMTNFSQVIAMIKESIGDLVGFSNCLLPILMTLMITTGSIVSANMIQPILLFLITFIGNVVMNVLLPITLVSTALGIVSKVSDKVQMDKLAKFLKSRCSMGVRNCFNVICEHFIFRRFINQ